MKNLGYILITLGFLAASWVASQHHIEMNWLYFLPLAGLAVAGVVVVRATTRAQMEHAETVASNIEDIDRSLTAIVEKVTQLNREKGEIETYEVRHKIDEMLMDDLDTFVRARETIGVRYGLHAYADVMSHFAAGDRYLNRIWSASADGYVDEVNAFLDRAQEQFADTLELFQKLRAQHG
jgi:succinate dehydrogenase/fumarate reductase flavoprotein subunit